MTGEKGNLRVSRFDHPTLGTSFVNSFGIDIQDCNLRDSNEGQDKTVDLDSFAYTKIVAFREWLNQCGVPHIAEEVRIFWNQKVVSGKAASSQQNGSEPQESQKS